ALEKTAAIVQLAAKNVHDVVNAAPALVHQLLKIFEGYFCHAFYRLLAKSTKLSRCRSTGWFSCGAGGSIAIGTSLEGSWGGLLPNWRKLICSGCEPSPCSTLASGTNLLIATCKLLRPFSVMASETKRLASFAAFFLITLSAVSCSNFFCLACSLV